MLYRDYRVIYYIKLDQIESYLVGTNYQVEVCMQHVQHFTLFINRERKYLVNNIAVKHKQITMRLRSFTSKLFQTKVVKAKKGKGSYNRKGRNSKDYALVVSEGAKELPAIVFLLL